MFSCQRSMQTKLKYFHVFFTTKNWKKKRSNQNFIKFKFIGENFNYFYIDKNLLNQLLVYLFTFNVNVKVPIAILENELPNIILYCNDLFFNLSSGSSDIK